MPMLDTLVARRVPVRRRRAGDRIGIGANGEYSIKIRDYQCISVGWFEMVRGGRRGGCEVSEINLLQIGPVKLQISPAQM